MSSPDIIFPHLKITIDSLSKDAFKLFGSNGITIYWYGIFITLGVLAGILIVSYNAKRFGQNPDIYLDFAFIAIPLCIIGARIYYVIFEWNAYKDNLISILDIRLGGLAIYGAVIAAFLTSIWYTKRKKLSFLFFMDIGIVGLVIGQAIGRFGNFFNREAFGGFTNSFFAMCYEISTVESELITEDILNNVVSTYGTYYIQVHPTFLYESLWNFALLAFLLWYSRRKKFDGQIMAFYLLFYGIGRFWIEGLRTDQLFLFGTRLPVSQLLSALCVVFSVIFIVYKMVRPKEKLTSLYLQKESE